jgi:hypothetical protein
VKVKKRIVIGGFKTTEEMRCFETGEPPAEAGKKKDSYDIDLTGRAEKLD